MIKEPKREPSPEEMDRNVAESVATAIEVLQHFEGSLVRGGFADGADSYRALARTLVGQRGWSSSRNREMHQQRFDELAERARSVLDLLAPYADAMRMISVLGGGEPVGVERGTTAVEPAKSTESADVSDEEVRVRELIAASKRPLSVTRLRERTRMGRQELARVLERLVGDGCVEARRQGGRAVYSRARGS